MKPRRTKPVRESAKVRWEKRQKAIREFNLMYGRPDQSPKVIAAENLAKLKFQRVQPLMWITTDDLDEPCAICLSPIIAGQKVHTRGDGTTVHHRHPKPPEQEQTACPTCWLVGPCDCE